MSGAIVVTRQEMTATELRAASGKARSARTARRMLAIALVLEGMDRKTAAETCGMDRQTLRDWVRRYNAEGAGGADGPPLARPAAAAHAGAEGRAGGSGRDGPGSEARRGGALAAP